MTEFLVHVELSPVISSACIGPGYIALTQIPAHDTAIMCYVY